VTDEPFRGFERTDFLGAFGFFETGDGVLLVANDRVIDGRTQTVWDLPGGRVEPGETLKEALSREMREECGIEVAVGGMLFLAEGERVRGGERVGVWRSFFFAVGGDAGAIDVGGDPSILDFRFAPRGELAALLHAPYHRGFLEWLENGAVYVSDRWED